MGLGVGAKKGHVAMIDRSTAGNIELRKADAGSNLGLDAVCGSVTGFRAGNAGRSEPGSVREPE